MPTRVSQFAGRLIETGWLAAVIVVPVFFNVWSQRVFEPDKLTLLRSIVFIMVAAAVVLIAETRLPSREKLMAWLRTPLVIPVLLMTGAIALSSALSVVPWMSVTGGYNRLQGLLTWSAYVVVFLSIVALVRNRLQVDRLLYAIIIPSLPVGLYGIVQKFGQEIMPWQGDTTNRIASTMGNSIFVAAYLILTVPLTIVRLTAALRDLDEEEGNAPVLRVSGYLVLLAVQIMAVVFSQSRGPLLGLIGGVFFLMLLLASLRASRQAMLAVLGLGATVAAFLVVFNLPNSPLAPLRDTAYIGRLGRVFETEGGTGRVRVLIWQGAVEMIAADPARAVVGYGPESMHVAYNPYYPPELGQLESRNASPDRSHNETFDVLVTTGLVGFAAYLFLFTSLFYMGLRWLGLNESRGWGVRFLALWFGAGVLSVLGFRLWSGDWTFFGVALPAGMMAGLFAYVAWRALTGWQPPERRGTLLLAGVLAAIIAHFIEIHFGIAIAATRTLFFALLGMLVVVGHFAAENEEVLEAPEEAPTNTKRSRRRRRVVGGPSLDFSSRLWTSRGFLLLALLITMVFSFVVFSSLNFSDPEQRLRIFVLGWLFIMTWGIGSLVLATETLVVPGTRGSGFATYAGIGLGAAVLYGVLHLGVLRAGRNAGAATSEALLFLYYSGLLTIMLAWALSLTLADPKPAQTARTRFAPLYPLALGVAAVLALTVNVNEVRADIHYKQGWVLYHNSAARLQAQGQLDNAKLHFSQAVFEYDRALNLDGSEDYYWLFKGKALLEDADTRAQQLDRQLAEAGVSPGGFSEYGDIDPRLQTAVDDRDAAFERAVSILTQARDMAPLNTDHHANLGRAYQVWADRTFDPEAKAERFELSRQYFADAIAHSPNNAGLREELATTEYLAGNLEAAREHLQAALEIDPEFTRPYRLQGMIARDAEDWAEAEENFQRYLESRDGRRDVTAWSALAFVLGKQAPELPEGEAREKYEAAVAANQEVLRLLGGQDLDTLRNLAILYNEMGDRGESCRQAARGLELAEDPALAQFYQQLGCEQLGLQLPSEELTPTIEGQTPLGDSPAPTTP